MLEIQICTHDKVNFDNKYHQIELRNQVNIYKMIIDDIIVIMKYPNDLNLTLTIKWLILWYSYSY